MGPVAVQPSSLRQKRKAGNRRQCSIFTSKVIVIRTGPGHMHLLILKPPVSQRLQCPCGSSSIRLPLWGSVCNGPLEVREAVPALLQRCSTDVVEHDETAMGRAKWRWGAWLCFFFLFKTCLCGSHRDVDCLMLWKLTREGDVGIDMAWVIRARMECCSCHRWKRFLTAERTCHTGGQTIHRQSLPISGHTSKERFRKAKAPVKAFRCAEV